MYQCSYGCNHKWYPLTCRRLRWLWLRRLGHNLQISTGQQRYLELIGDKTCRARKCTHRDSSWYWYFCLCKLVSRFRFWLNSPVDEYVEFDNITNFFGKYSCWFREEILPISRTAFLGEAFNGDIGKFVSCFCSMIGQSYLDNTVFTLGVSPITVFA